MYMQILLELCQVVLKDAYDLSAGCPMPQNFDTFVAHKAM